MIYECGYNLIKTCQKSVVLRRVSPFGRNRFSSPCSIFTSATNRTGKKYTVSQIWKRQNEFVSQSKEKFQDTFGTLETAELQYERVKDDPEDVEEYKRIKSGQGKTVAQYIKEIKNHLENNEYEKAVNALEIDMVNDCKPPISFIYRLLISYNGKQGNLKEAYRLYTNLKKRNSFIDGGIYTSLFNACANCRNSFYALEKAAAIREYLMKDKNHSVNLPNYNAMLKAFGRHGDLNTCFQIVDEIMERRDKVEIETYRFLLQACISDPNSGLRHAVLTWRKMLQFRLKPTIFEFNLMLRCVRDCFFGDVDLLNDLIKQIKMESEMFFKKKVTISMKDGVKKRTVVKIPVPKHEALKSLLVNQNEENSESNSANCSSPGKDVINVKNQHENLLQLEIDKSESESNLEGTEKLQSENHECSSQSHSNTELSEVNLKTNFNLHLPNLLSATPSMGSAISFNSMTKPHERFLCFGGVKGFLKTMSSFGAVPNIKTFTLLLDLVTNSDSETSLAAEEEIMREAQAHNVKLDTGFFNVLIKRRIPREVNSLIQDTLKEMQSAGVGPDLITIGVLASSCSTHEKGLQLIEIAQKMGIRLNSEILGALLSQASKTSDLKYVKTILEAAKENDTTLSPKFIALLNRIVNKEKHLREKNRSLESSENPSSNLSCAENEI